MHGNRTTPKNTGKTGVSDQSGAESGAPEAHSGRIDADLRLIIEAWPDLTESSKAEIFGMVRAAGG